MNNQISLNDKKRGLNLPTEYSCSLAEFMGILTGDGYIGAYNGNYFTEIAGHSELDSDYLSKYVFELILKLFNIKSTIIVRKNQQSMYLRISSKGLYHYLLNLGFVAGRKTELKIPSWITNEEKFMLSFVKGLIDTDGSLVLLNRKQKKYTFYPRISLSLENEEIVNLVGKWLVSKGLSVCFMVGHNRRIYKGLTKYSKIYRIHINGRKQTTRFIRFVGFRNKKHLEKYDKMKKNGTSGI